ncbi:holo-ACP synthase, partial [Chloroflexota bacterium]
MEIGRIKQAIARWGDRFLQRVYTEPELTLYRKKPSSLAARFAGKEAVLKALQKPTGIGWKQIEVLSDSNGKPLVCLYGRAKEQAGHLGLSNLAITLSHSREYAIAFV